MNRYLLTRKNRLRTRQYFMLFTIFLVFISGILPSFELMTINAESDAIVEPIVSKDIEGENEKEIIPGEDYNYNVKVSLPENISGYESMTITDDFDKRLTIQDTSVLVNDEENNELQVEVNKQSVSLNLLNEQLDELVGKEITLQITTQIKEDVATDEEITNIAEVVINEDIILETDEAIVTIIDSDTSENKDTNELADKSKENTKEDDKSLNKKAKEETSELEEKEEKTVTKSKSEKESSIQVQSNDGITMNDTDFYAISHDGWLVQYEGDPALIEENNDTTWEKAKVKTELSGTANNALGKAANAFYAVSYVNGQGDLFKIDPNGNTTKIDNLTTNRTVRAGTMSKDGEKFLYITTHKSGYALGSIDVNTGEKTKKLITNQTGVQSFVYEDNGDMVVDGGGYVWHLTYDGDSSHLVRIDIETGDLERVIPIKYPNGDVITFASSLAFLSDGNLVMSSGDTHLIDAGTGLITKNIDGNVDYSIYDFASTVYPVLQPDLNIEKSVNPEEDVFIGDELTYTLNVINTGNIAATETQIIDALPEGVSYVEG